LNGKVDRLQQVRETVEVLAVEADGVRKDLWGGVRYARVLYLRCEMIGAVPNQTYIIVPTDQRFVPVLFINESRLTLFHPSEAARTS
jgi:hypothetical protein